MTPTLTDLIAQALADAATETRDFGPLPDHHWQDRAREVVAKLTTPAEDLGAPIYEAAAFDNGFAPLVVTRGGMNRLDVQLWGITRDPWGAGR